MALAHALRLEVVAEGIEGEDQRAFLAARGCDILRGDLSPRPLAAAECRERLREAVAVRTA